MVSTQDVSFGTMWMRLVGDGARWDAGDEHTPALQVASDDGELRFGQGLVAVWVAGSGPVLVCDPHKGLRALKKFPAGTTVDELRTALRAAGAVKSESEPRQDG